MNSQHAESGEIERRSFRLRRVDKARRALGAIHAGDDMLSASAGVAASPLEAHGRSTLVERAHGPYSWPSEAVAKHT